MKIIYDEQRVKRNANVAHTLTLGSIFILLASVVLPTIRVEMAPVGNMLFLLGAAVAIAGMFLANRWVRKPRPEAAIAHALGGLSDQYRAYLYQEPVRHVLLTPYGLVVLELVQLDGQFTFQQGKWRQRMSLSRAFRFLFEPQLGDPVRRAQSSASQLRELVNKTLGGETLEKQVPVAAMVFFTHPQVKIELDNAPIPIVTYDKVKKAIPVKGAKLQADLYKRIQEWMENGL
jgi:hypothetical protein